MGDWMFLCEPQLKRLFFVIHDFSRTLSKFDKRNYCEFEHFNFESSLWIRVILVIFKMLGNIPDESNVSKKEAVAFFFSGYCRFLLLTYLPHLHLIILWLLWHSCKLFMLFYDFSTFSHIFCDSQNVFWQMAALYLIIWVFFDPNFFVYLGKSKENMHKITQSSTTKKLTKFKKSKRTEHSKSRDNLAVFWIYEDKKRGKNGFTISEITHIKIYARTC